MKKSIHCPCFMNLPVFSGSVASEGACEAARQAAEELKKRLNPIKLELWAETKEEPTWEKVVAKATSRLVLQTASANFVPLGRDRMHGLPWQVRL